MARRHQAGNGVLTLLVLLALLAGAGAWNYQRNVAAERAEYRPYRGYTDEAIEQLASAYETKQTGDSKRYEAVAARRATAAGKAYFDEQVREFERVQRTGEAKKALQGELAESQTTLKLIAAEKRKRAEERNRVQLFFKRLLTVEL
jgi:hypothetical protein